MEDIMEMPQKKLKLELPYDPARPLWGIYLVKPWVKYTCTPMFTAVLFIKMEDTNMSTDRGMNKADVHVYNGVH